MVSSTTGVSATASSAGAETSAVVSVTGSAAGTEASVVVSATASSVTCGATGST